MEEEKEHKEMRERVIHHLLSFIIHHLLSSHDLKPDLYSPLPT